MTTELEQQLVDQLRRAAETTAPGSLKPLIEEARRRGSRIRARRLGLQIISGCGVAAAVAGLVVVGLHMNSVEHHGPTPADPASPLPTSAHPAPGGPACSAGNLTITAIGPESMMTEESAVLYRVSNHGKRTCVLHGRPAATFFDRTGRQVQLRLANTSPFMSAEAASGLGEPIRLGQGTSVFLLIAKNSCVLKEATRIDHVTLELPNHGGILTAPTTFQQRRFFSCASNSDPGQQYAISAFSPSRDFLPTGR